MPSFSMSNGIACLGPSFFASLAFCLGLVASSLCNFVELDDDSALRGSPQFASSVGFWCYEQVGSGSRFEYGSFAFEDRWDDKFEVARSLGLTANIIGFVVWLIYLCAGCVPMPPAIFGSIGCLCWCACMFEGFKFWIFRSEFFCDGDDLGCSLDTGGKCSVTAVVFWFVAFMMAAGHSKERMDAAKADEEGGDAGGDAEEA
mmetsp:Transcript_27063/g.56683  ORF Transcript_27063/g.56683 Transcript_27063/m.56683 type:complete len:202 (-) Transcript_27063:224-829(-)